MSVELRLLGPPLVLVDGGPAPPDLEYRKHMALLVYLACSGEKWRTRDHLGELLWPRGFAARSVAQGLVPIRRAVGSGLETSADRVRLAAGAVRLDLDEARRLVDERAWQAASALVRGEFCETLEIRRAPGFDHWLLTQRLRWRETGLEILVCNGERLLDAGDPVAARHEFLRGRELHPRAERAIHGLMHALVLGDLPDAALEEYELFVDELREAGGEPSAETRRLAERIRRLGARRPPGGDAEETRRPPLCGRTGHLAALRALWSQVRSERRPAIALIEGAAGYGKSRLLEELTRRAGLEDAATGTTRLLPGDADHDGAMLVGLARGGLLQASAVSAAPPEALAALAQRIPEWAARYPALTSTAPLPLGEALGHVVHTVGEEQPVLLVIDDAHWFDPGSLGAIQALLRDHPRSPVLVVLALETGAGDDPIDRLRSRLGRDCPGSTVKPGPLSRDEVMELAQWALPSLTEEQLDRIARRIQADSAGIPFLAVELLSAVALGLDLGHLGGAWPAPQRTLTDTLPGDLPDSVVGALRVGFRRRSQPAQALLRVLAVVGQQLTEAMIVRVSELDPTVADAALAELEWHRWLNADARGYDFVAGIARRVVERDMCTAGQREQILARWRGG